jgi:acetoin utilization protein AcuB
MLVGNRMSFPVLSVTPDIPVQDALAQMRKERVSRYPVVDKKGKLVGIVSVDDLLNASPSEATSLSVWEVNYLLSKITVERVMTKDVITVNEDATLEQAARLMADNRIGGLPVMRDGALVGIITQTDIFHIFLEMLGGRESGMRVSAMVKDEKGMLHKLTQAIDEAGGNIIALSTYAGNSTENRGITIKLSQLDVASVKKVLLPLVEQITDIREIQLGS